ncbi:MAG: hypothetical protein ACJ768_03085 [Gaiellaceae bacterium]
MRIRAALVAALVPLLLLVLAAPAGAARGRVLIAFIPQKPEPKMPLLFDLAERDFAYGVTSPTLGGYTKRQMLLDMSQGTRIANNAYPRSLGRLDLVMLDGSGRLSGWAYNAERAKDAPGDVVPGLLAQTLENAGLHVGYVGVVGFEQTEATVAANRIGRVPEISLGTMGTFAHRALALWARTNVLVARFPPDEAGLEALDKVVAGGRPADLIYAVRAPPAGRQRLLPTGMLGPGFRRKVLTSPTTRRIGLIAATDVPTTVLDHFGLKTPRQMEGRVIKANADGSPEAVREHIGRLNVVLGRRGSAIHDWFYVWLAILGLMWFARRRSGVRTAVRIAFLGVMWLPGMALLTAQLEPSRTSELLVLSLGSFAAAAATDRLLPWPVAPALPAALVLGAHFVDLARGSPLIGASLAGPNPVGGARFFGIGNELEAILAMELFLGLGAALTLAPRRWVPWGFAIAALIAAAVEGSGRLGADVGAVITLGAGAGGAVIASLGGRPSRRAVLIACAVPLLGILGLIGLDVVTSGGAHLTRTVLHNNGVGDLLDIVKRREIISVTGLKRISTLLTVLLGVALMVFAIRRRDEVFEPLREYPAFMAGIWGAFFATVLGALGNDSGPLIFEVGFLMLLMATGYARSRPIPARVPVS